MNEASLPSPDTGANGYHLRRIAAKAISAMEVVAVSYPAGAHPGATALKAFFDACSAAVATVGKAIPVMTIDTTGSVTEIAVGATNQLTVGKGGSSGTVSYVSSDTDVATVNGSGLITAVAEGTFTITANMTEGAAHKAASISITLEVVPAP